LSRSFKAERADERIEIIDDALIEAIELRPLLLVDPSICGKGAENAGGQWRIDAFERLQEDKADRVSVRKQPAKRFSEEIVRGVKRSTNALKLLVLKALRQELDEIQSFDATGAHFGQPGYETDLLYLAGLLALCLGGPGPISVDALLSRLQTSRGSQA
jgi:hypothetical protein